MSHKKNILVVGIDKNQEENKEQQREQPVEKKRHHHLFSHAVFSESFKSKRGSLFLVSFLNALIMSSFLSLGRTLILMRLPMLGKTGSRMQTGKRPLSRVRLAYIMNFLLPLKPSLLLIREKRLGVRRFLLLGIK